MNDLSSIYMRQHGVDIIGKKLLFSFKVDFSEFVRSDVESREIQLKIELMSLIVLRHLYSVEKNKKSFKLVFPPEVFGPFIDIGNYESDWEKYENTLQKIGHMDETERTAILANLSKM